MAHGLSIRSGSRCVDSRFCWQFGSACGVATSAGTSTTASSCRFPLALRNGSWTGATCCRTSSTRFGWSRGWWRAMLAWLWSPASRTRSWRCSSHRRLRWQCWRRSRQPNCRRLKPWLTPSARRHACTPTGCAGMEQLADRWRSAINAAAVGWWTTTRTRACCCALQKPPRRQGHHWDKVQHGPIGPNRTSRRPIHLTEQPAFQGHRQVHRLVCYPRARAHSRVRLCPKQPPKQTPKWNLLHHHHKREWSWRHATWRLSWRTMWACAAGRNQSPTPRQGQHLQWDTVQAWCHRGTQDLPGELSPRPWKSCITTRRRASSCGSLETIYQPFPWPMPRPRRRKPRKRTPTSSRILEPNATDTAWLCRWSIAEGRSRLDTAAQWTAEVASGNYKGSEAMPNHRSQTIFRASSSSQDDAATQVWPGRDLWRLC